MAKLHYFLQLVPDQDDALLVDAKRYGLVPDGCLLGGVLVSDAIKKNKSPCDNCKGPRNRCGGKPEVSTSDAGAGAERERLKRLLLGDDRP